MDISRRFVLAGAATTLGVALAGCSDPDDEDDDGTTGY